MLTYELKKTPGVPLYEALYRCIREDILTGKLPAGARLPSKRSLSAHLEISKITVEGAYGQLLAEGFIRSVEKRGYYVEEVAGLTVPAPVDAKAPAPEPLGLDLTGRRPGAFPFSVWSSLQRQVMLDLGEQLLQPIDNQGVWALRQAIAGHLRQFRGMAVSPEQIVLGAGTDFLYNLLVQLLGRELCYGVEEPGYGKIRKIYEAAGAPWSAVPLDREGVSIPQAGQAQVLHISPSHHFPTGRITSMARRRELLEWAGTERWIIEDDYDSEFRFNAHPMPALYAMDSRGRVIYMNTFSKTLAPSIRVSFMVLPQALMARFQEKLGFYSCTVPSFQQYTLARFLCGGYFEKHINRMRRHYRTMRDRVLELIRSGPLGQKLTILEEDAGLHFIVRVETSHPDRVLVDRCRQAGLEIRCLSDYYHGRVPEEAAHCLIVNYSSLTEKDLPALWAAIEKITR